MKAKYRIITLASTVSLTLSILAGCSGKQLNGPGQSGSQSTGESVTIGGYNQRYIWRQRVFRCQRRDHFRRGLRRENHGKW